MPAFMLGMRRTIRRFSRKSRSSTEPVARAPLLSCSPAKTNEPTRWSATPPTSGECGGLRMLIGPRGFCLLTPDGIRAYAPVQQVLGELSRATGKLGALLTDSVRTELAQIEERHREERMCESEAARKLLMLVGPMIEVAVAAAIGSHSEAMMRARASRAERSRPSRVSEASASPERKRPAISPAPSPLKVSMELSDL